MLLRIAWLNVWRNPTRSLLVMLSVAVGLWAGVFTMAFVKGLYAENIRDNIENYLSHIQIHHIDYVREPSLNAVLDFDPQTRMGMKRDARIRAVSLRTRLQVMVASSLNAVGVDAVGIDPDEEDGVTGLSKRIIEGRPLSKEHANGILISSKTASKLKVKLKNKVVLSFQDKSGNLSSAVFRVQGIFRSGNSVFDECTVFVLAEQMQQMAGMTSTEFHEVALLLKDIQKLKQVKASLRVAMPDYLVQDWMELSPELDLIINSFNLYMYIFIGIILLALSFGIINTMLMAVLERIREFGMLMAIGMNKSRLFFIIIIETILLSLIGCPLGMGFAWLTIKMTAERGIDLTSFSEGFSKFGFAPIIHPELPTSYYLQIGVMTFLAALLSSLYPAFKAFSLKPVEAIRKI